MNKKADTWMPLYVGEYLADTTNLNTEQHGAYCLMLMAAWKRGGSLPNDDAQLSAITKLSMGRWKAHRSVLTAFFRESDGSLSHKRVTEERIKAQQISDKKAVAGSKGGNAKAKNSSNEGSEPGSKAVADAIAKAKQTATPAGVNSPSPLPTPSELIQPADAGLPPAEPPTLTLVDPGEEGLPACPHRRLIGLFVQKLPELPKPRVELWANSAGAENLRARWRWLMTAKREDGTRYATSLEEGIAWFEDFFDRVAESEFLTGRNGKWRDCSLAWLMQRQKFNNVIEGQYQHGSRVA